jgi:hypothetical protein
MMHFPAFILGFGFEVPLDRPMRSSINVDFPMKICHMADTRPLEQLIIDD